MLTNPY